MPVEIRIPEELPPRSQWQAMARGFRGRCPHCGEGKLFRAFLKPVETCAVCGEDLSHQRADDLPPYLTIVVVGHVLLPVILAVQFVTDFSVLAYLAIYLPLTAALTLALLQPVKGAVVGLQWALRMHGFDGSADPDATPEGFLPTPQP